MKTEHNTMKIKGAALTVKNIYSEIFEDTSWVEQNALVINAAVNQGLALCGSAGRGVATRGCGSETPKDLDFVTDSLKKAQKFIQHLQDYLSKRQVFYSMLTNHRTKFCPEFVHSHIRLQCPFWMEICVFVLDIEQIELDCFFVDGCRVQNYSQMYRAAEELEKRDGKKRVDDSDVDWGIINPEPKDAFDDDFNIELHLGGQVAPKPYPKPD